MCIILFLKARVVFSFQPAGLYISRLVGHDVAKTSSSMQLLSNPLWKCWLPLYIVKKGFWTLKQFQRVQNLILLSIFRNLFSTHAHSDPKSGQTFWSVAPLPVKQTKNSSKCEWKGSVPLSTPPTTPKQWYATSRRRWSRRTEAEWKLQVWKTKTIIRLFENTSKKYNDEWSLH